MTRVRGLPILQKSAPENMFLVFFFFFFFSLLVLGFSHTCNVYLEHTRIDLLENFDWESTTFPRSAILPVIKVRGSIFC